MILDDEQVGHSVFQFTSSREFLRKEFERRIRRNERFSVRAWAKQLGLKHHALLTLVLKNERSLNPPLSFQIRDGLKLKNKEARYFDILVMYENAKSKEEKALYENILESLLPDQRFRLLEVDTFRMISDWYHLAIVEMTNLENFKNDPVWISNRLGHTVTPAQVTEDVDRLIRLKLLKKEKDKSLKRTASEFLTTKDIPSEAIRSYHTQIMNLALKALEEDAVTEKGFESYTMSVDVANIPKAKLLMQEFQKKMSRLLEKQSGQEVYQFNMQLFRLTRGKTKGEKKS